MSQLTNLKQGNPLTTAQIKRRAKWNQLVLSLPVPHSTSIKTAEPVKARPATGVFSTA